MADKTPDFTLTPQDAPWGRWVTSGIEGILRQLSRSDLDQTAANKGLTASVGSLAEQVRDLTGRVSYSSDGTGTTQQWTSTVTSEFAWGPSVTFTLTEPRVVSAQFSVRANAEGTATSATTNVVTAARGIVRINNASVGGARGEVGVSIPSVAGSTFRYDYSINGMVCRSLVQLPVGTHTVQGGFLFVSADVLGGSGSAKFTASDPNIFVDVLQTTGA